MPNPNPRTVPKVFPFFIYPSKKSKKRNQIITTKKDSKKFNKNIKIDDTERSLIIAYRAQPSSVQDAIKRMLGIGS